MVSNIIKPYDLEDKKNAETLEIKKGKVIFQMLALHMIETLVGENISLCINPGEKVDRRRSGAGKSTLVSSLLLYTILKEGLYKLIIKICLMSHKKVFVNK